MEASQKPPAESFEGAGTVRTLDDRVVIECLTINDARVADVVRQRAEVDQSPVQTVTNAIEIGARVLEREGMAAEVDYVQREFERTATEVREQFSEQARGLTETVQRELERVFGAEGGAMSKALDGHADEIAAQIARHFGDESSEAVQHRVKELVEKAMRDSKDSLVKHFSSDGDTNPLADFKTGVNTTVNEAVRQLRAEEKTTREKLALLQTEVVRLTEQTEAGKALAESEAAGTRKGFTFEERVNSALEVIACTRGDAATHTGSSGAEGGGKKGDTLVELCAADGPAAGRVLFEAKDRKLSKNEAWRELNDGMAGRAAAFGVLVVAAEDLVPAGRDQLTEYEGNKMIVAVDRDDPSGLALEVAYRLAAARVSMARENDLSVDAAAVRDAAADAISTLQQAQAIRSSLTGIKTSSDKARAGLDALVESIRAKLERIDALVASAE